MLLIFDSESLLSVCNFTIQHCFPLQRHVLAMYMHILYGYIKKLLVS